MIRQLPLPLPHDAAMGVDDFLVTACNREAAAWVEKWPDWPAHGLIVTGLEGNGKTHLLTLWLAKSGGAAVTTERLLAEDTFSLTAQTACLALDDADKLVGNAEAEEKLFHLYNRLKEIKGSLFLTMSCGAGQAGWRLPDLRSRLVTLPMAALLPPDDDLLDALIVKQFRDRQVTLDPGVVSYVARRAPRDAAGLRNLIDRLDRESLAAGRKVSVSLAREILGNDDDG